jgi:hypothetical protein
LYIRLTCDHDHNGPFLSIRAQLALNSFMTIRIDWTIFEVRVRTHTRKLYYYKTRCSGKVYISCHKSWRTCLYAKVNFWTQLITLTHEKSVQTDSLSPPHFIEVPVPSQERERSCICVLGVSILNLLFFHWILELFWQSGSVFLLDKELCTYPNWFLFELISHVSM